MIDVRGLVPPGAVLLDLKAETKDQVLAALAETAAALFHLDAAAILTPLLERERLGTTGLGNGIAVPHGKVRDLPATAALFVRLSPPLDFQAVDGEPVDLVLALLTPDRAPGDHLKALARIARALRDRDLCNRLRSAPDAEAVQAILDGRAPPAAAA